MKKTLLHIANDYSGSTVYKNLVTEFDNLGITQVVYTPIRDKNRIGKNEVNLKVNSSKIIYSHVLNKFSDRVFYRGKITKIVKDIEKKVDLRNIKLLHAHTWYSDGGVAYLLFLKYKIPYVVTIRNSDLNLFQKFLINERGFGCEILENAKKVIVISSIYKERVLSLKSLSKVRNLLESKMKVIPNGVDKFWIKNGNLKVLEKKNKYNLLFVGKFTSGKNVLLLIKAIANINKNESKVHLHLVGGGGDCHSKVVKFVSKNSEDYTYYGRISNFKKLRERYQECDIFVMPSKHETFGLVYVEAMLQGLPILYTENEGIDGLYEERIGEKITSGGVSEIETKLLIMFDEYDKYQIPLLKLKENHDWVKLALVYKKIYSSI